MNDDHLDVVDRTIVTLALLLTLVIAGFILVGCDGDTTTYISEAPEEGEVTEPILIPDRNITDIITYTNVASANISDNGLQIICVQGSTCSVTIDNSTSTDSSDNSNNSDNSITNP